ncbi:MAG: ATP-dependent DNA helicase [Planctomycetes bacterium]|nr:ATP-dependent DNA helicase [Planctomycetota bacterium]
MSDAEFEFLPEPAASVPRTVADFLGADGAIARRLPDYERRPQQLQMAQAIERALQGKQHLIAEAGTGVGKSFAYLLPAVLHADTHQGEGPVIVSTRTIALQEQLEHKDLPFLHAVLPFEWSSVTAVGRSHYVCLRRMHLAEREQTLFADPERKDQLRGIVQWSLTTREGTRMDLPAPVQPEVWEEVQAEHGNCLHRACKHYDHCHWQRARRRMATAQVLIVNHSLYMADLALRLAGASLLPDHRVVIFDEAHHLERVATESIGLRLSARMVGWHLRRLHGGRHDRSLLRNHGSSRALLLWEELRQQNDAFFAMLEDRLGGSGEGQAIGDEKLDEPLSQPLLELAQDVVAAATRVEEVDARMELNARGSGLQGLANVVRSLCTPGGHGIPLVRWVEGHKHGPILCGAPLDVRATLREHLFGAGRTCILTSATLGPADDTGFSWFRGQLGIERADTLRVGSPFDYRRVCELVVEEAMPDPTRDAQAFGRAVGERTLQHVLQNGGRALLLCTSWAMVRELAAALHLPLHEAGIELLVQGQLPIAQLLARKRAVPTSVLIGTDSLWEGIDVRGDALTLVVVTKLPFANPSHPLTKARMQAITDDGGDPFLEWSLPEAILKFRQGFGRLIRSQQDRGKVVVMDPRVRTKRYGMRFLASLPFGDEDG